MTRFVGRANVRKRLAPLEGEPGRTHYAEGEARIEAAGETIVVRPPFGLAHEGEYDVVRLGPWVEPCRASSAAPSPVRPCSSGCPTSSTQLSSPSLDSGHCLNQPVASVTCLGQSDVSHENETASDHDRRRRRCRT